MQSRLDRYEEFLDKQYRDGFRKPEEYSIAAITPALRDRMKNGHFKRAVFTGMGCSAIVSDVVRAFFTSIDTELEFPLPVFHRLAHAHDRMPLLTSGGKLGALGEEHGVSIARWQLSEPDREYPLFHVGQ